MPDSTPLALSGQRMLLRQASRGLEQDGSVRSRRAPSQGAVCRLQAPLAPSETQPTDGAFLCGPCRLGPDGGGRPVEARLQAPSSFSPLAAKLEASS